MMAMPAPVVIRVLRFVRLNSGDVLTFNRCTSASSSLVTSNWSCRTPAMITERAPLRNGVPMDHPAAHVGERVLHDERGRVERLHDAAHAADLQARHDAVEDLAVVARHPAARLVDRDA